MADNTISNIEGSVSQNNFGNSDMGDNNTFNFNANVMEVLKKQVEWLQSQLQEKDEQIKLLLDIIKNK